LRCLVPLAILFGISYLLRRFGLVAVEAPELPDDRDEDGDEVAEDETSKANPDEITTVENTKESQQ